MRFTRIFALLIGLILLASAVVLGVFYFYQEKIIFFPERLQQDFRFKFPDEFLEGNLRLDSHTSVNYLIFNPASSKGTLLYFHGNAGSLKDWGWTASEIARKTGWCVWMMDYPGFGKSTPVLPKDEKILLEMGRAFRTEISKKRPNIPLVYFGRSIGTGIASALAAENPSASGLILETPYRSLAKLGHEIYPFLPEFISRFNLDNEKQLPLNTSTPILILHGTQDQVVPFTHGNFLSGITARSQFVAIENGDHNNLSDFKEYWAAVTRFLESVRL